MPILIKANLACNFACEYCYEHPIREEAPEIDFPAVEETIRRLWKEQYERRIGKKKKLDDKDLPLVTLHGGEPTILPRADFERFLKLAFELSKRSSIQTNGLLIDDDMIELFKKYNTGVGISIDGPWPLNELRGIGTKAQRKKQTRKILKTLDRLRTTELPKEFWTKDKDGKEIPRYLKPSVIAVIHKKNGLPDRREVLKQWVLGLHEKKIGGRLNICCTGNEEIDLTPQEAVDFYVDMFDFMMENGIDSFSPFRDIIAALKGESSYVCVFKECDPYSTPSCTTVLKDGSVGVCLRLYGDGKIYLRNDPMTHIRGDVLKQTDCKDCPWWKYCYGGCCGLAVDWDWRNKDRYCLAYKAMFEKALNVLKALRIKTKSKQDRGRKKDISRRYQGEGDHQDGIEHVDGNTRYVDSDYPDGGD